MDDLHSESDSIDSSGFPNAAALEDGEETQGETEVVGGAELNGTGEGSQPTPTLDPQPANEYFCGIRQWRPQCLQIFRNEIFFTVLLCSNCLIEGALASGFVAVVLSTIEKRYNFSSVVAGIIVISFDVAVLISVLFISYFGGKGHKPKWLGASLIVMGIGAFVFSSPQFILGSYDVGRDGRLKFEACADGEDFSSDCDEADGVAVAFFVVGQLLIGFGSAPLFTVGTAYLDEIVHPKRVSIHLGCFYTLTIIGPAIGFGLGGAFLSVYVDPWHSTNLEQSDPGWVGAWWLCFIFAGTVSILLSIPFFMFPRLLPSSHLIKLARQEEMAKVYRSKYGDKEETDFASGLKTLPVHLKSLCTNPAWVMITIALTCSVLVVSGMGVFLPKYWESQFHLTASTASLVAGAIGIPSGGIGVLTGALIIYFVKAKGRRIAIINWIITIIAFFAVFSFLITCPTVSLVGVEEPYPDGSKNDDLDSSCTIPCNCTSRIYEPVCGRDDLTYFSPCRAGCMKIPGTEIFENCTCIAQQQIRNVGLNFSNPVLVETFLPNSTASDGQCDADCDVRLGLFAVFSGLMVMLVFSLQVPNVLITVRCVAEQQRTLALGFQSVFLRLFGFIPGPIIIGAIFDSACILWQDECGDRGSCWVYENTRLSVGALSSALIGIFLNFVFTFICWLVYPKTNEGTTVNDDDKDQFSLTVVKSEEESHCHMRRDVFERSTESFGLTNKLDSVP